MKTSSAEPPFTADHPELYACCYDKSKFSATFAFHDGIKGDLVEIAWSFYVLKTGSGVTLFDTGHTHKPDDLLKELEIDPAKVDRVIITHIHFDHIGNLPNFPNAKIIISRKDRDAYLASKLKPQGGVTYAENIAAILQDETRTHVVDQSETLADGLVFEVVGGHTTGSSVIHINWMNTHYVLTGDECYLCKNAEEKRPVGIAANLKLNAEFLARISDPSIVLLPCHDPLIFTKFPIVKPNIARIF